MNRGQIKTLAAGFAEDPDQSKFSGLYDSTLDRAQEQFALDSKSLFKDASTITTVDGTASYDLPTDFMWEKRVTHKGLELLPISRAQLLYYQNQDWSDDSGTPKYYLIDPEEAQKKILLYPKPEADDAGPNLILSYYPLPASSTDDSATPLNSTALLAQFHMGIAALLAWILLQRVPSTAEMVRKKAELWAIFQRDSGRATDLFKNTARAGMRMRGGRYWKKKS